MKNEQEHELSQFQINLLLSTLLMIIAGSVIGLTGDGTIPPIDQLIPSDMLDPDVIGLGMFLLALVNLGISFIDHVEQSGVYESIGNRVNSLITKIKAVLSGRSS